MALSAFCNQFCAIAWSATVNIYLYRSLTLLLYLKLCNIAIKGKHGRVFDFFNGVCGWATLLLVPRTVLQSFSSSDVSGVLCEPNLLVLRVLIAVLLCTMRFEAIFTICTVFCFT